MTAIKRRERKKGRKNDLLLYMKDQKGNHPRETCENTVYNFIEAPIIDHFMGMATDFYRTTPRARLGSMGVEVARG